MSAPADSRGFMEQKAREALAASGKTDLLLRFFDSQFFDEWIALTYLYKSTSPGVQDYLCNRLYSLPEAGIERYLSQLCHLMVTRPGSSLERVMVDLCARSLRVACKVYWLLLAISQDQPRNRHVADLRDACELAALNGYWEPPFRNPRLLPLSPVANSKWICSPPISPKMVTHGRQRGLLSPRARVSKSMSRQLSDRLPSPDRFLSPGRQVWPTSPNGFGNGLYSSVALDQGLEGLIGASPSTIREARMRLEKMASEVDGDSSPGPGDRFRRIHKELGDGEGVTALLERSTKTTEGGGPACLRNYECPADYPEPTSPPSSPRLRQTTFGATLDFIEALCDASANLTAFATEDRPWALQRGLAEINREIERASRTGVACWFPMGTRNERIVRLPVQEASILNSREKAPFVLPVEVLKADPEDPPGASPVRGSSPCTSGSPSVGGDSAQSLLERRSSHDSAGPGPGSQPDGAQHTRTDTATDGLGMQPPGAAASGVSPAWLERPVGTLPRRRSLSPSKAIPNGGLSRAFEAEHERSRSGRDPQEVRHSREDSAFSESMSSSQQDAEAAARPASPAQLTGKAGPLLAPSATDPLARDLNAAMAGFKGTGPMVGIRLELTTRPPWKAGRRKQASDPGLMSKLAAARPTPLDVPGSRSTADSDMWSSSKPLAATSSSSSAAAESQEPHTRGLLCRIGLCSICKKAAGETVPGASPSTTPEPYVRLHIKVHGADLRLGIRPSPRHQRVPSEEALMKMAGSMAPRTLPWHSLPSSPPVPHPGPSRDGISSPFQNHSHPFQDSQSFSPTAPSTGPRSSALMRKKSRPLANSHIPRPMNAPPDHPSLTKGRDAATAVHASARRMTEQRERERLLQEDACALYGERFETRASRIKKESQMGRRAGWALRNVIVKSGDDCRQELLAVQLIQSFADIFQAPKLPLWLRPFEVLVTSSRTALIEMIPDTLSIHALKSRSPASMSLRSHFYAKFVQGTQTCRDAQNAFVESMAGYSLISYLLQIKDRHNGNLLLDDAGHIIHIDFGFMLSNSPGGVNFESSPFKLTRELLEVMESNAEGYDSELFSYFKVLMIRGFLACRKHADRIILLVEMMQGCGCPAFKGGHRALQALRKRFHLNLPEPQCFELVLDLISESVDAWRTRQYDYYQRVLNGIL
ncbi:hypothetical protein WJX84_000186 [Apatococcus fuscideae]|uniref:1-phosphatidylinositol 4-kinase n=1 Tax=Apatococcus fuscideae TaxID=2026836 RepID=A0AAW1TAG4_9CHLO